MDISERQKNILEAIIRQYTESAKPVSSQFLEKRYDFGICPASIRIEMQKLTDDGFLHQPHTAAGRVPTDKGYRFFVDSLLEEEREMTVSLDFDFERAIEDEFEDIFRMSNSLTRSLAAASSLLVVGYLPNEDMIWKEGWEEVLQNPEFGEKELVANFINYLRYLEDDLKKYRAQDGVDIFIGAENKIPAADGFAAITFACQPAESEAVILSLVGPKRMAYEKNIALINNVLKVLE